MEASVGQVNKVESVKKWRTPLPEFDSLTKKQAVCVVTTASLHRAPVAQLDRAPVYETGGYRFDPCRVYSL